jgi:hypothetical protein
MLGLATYDRCDAQLEFLNGFDPALFVSLPRYVMSSPSLWQ